MYNYKIGVSKSYFPREITEKDLGRIFIQVIEIQTIYHPIRRVTGLKEITKDTLLTDLKNLITIVGIEETMIIVENTNIVTTPKKPLTVEDTNECSSLITYP